MRIDGERFVGTVQQRGGCKSELGLAQPGLTADQEWSIGGDGSINRVLFVVAQQVAELVSVRSTNRY
jgi:hypothetical protein